MRQSTREFVEKQVEKFQERFEVDYDAYPSIPRGALIAGLAKGLCKEAVSLAAKFVSTLFASPCFLGPNSTLPFMLQ